MAILICQALDVELGLCCKVMCSQTVSVISPGVEMKAAIVTPHVLHLCNSPLTIEYIHGLVQHCNIRSASVMVMLHSCAEPILLNISYAWIKSTHFINFMNYFTFEFVITTYLLIKNEVWWSNSLIVWGPLQNYEFNMPLDDLHIKCIDLLHKEMPNMIWQDDFGAVALCIMYEGYYRCYTDIIFFQLYLQNIEKMNIYYEWHGSGSIPCYGLIHSV